MENIPPAKPTFMNLPSEIRIMILRELFLMTRLTYGKRYIEASKSVTIKPKEQSLAILRVCRTTYIEGRSQWISRVLFNFEDGFTLMDKMCAQPRAIGTQIRHLRIAWTMMSEFARCTSFALILTLVSELNLDTFTILSPIRSCRHDYCDLKRVVSSSIGWKELYYVFPNCYTMRRGTNTPHVSGPVAQQDLKKTLSDRDGATSGGSVSVYRAKRSALSGLRSLQNPRYLVSPDKPGKIERHIACLGNRPCNSWLELDTLVVVKRGTNVDVTQVVPSTKTFDKSWKELRSQFMSNKFRWHRMRLYLGLERKGDKSFFLSHLTSEQLEKRLYGRKYFQITERDRYCDVDEYKWQWPIKKSKKSLKRRLTI
ncbi:hypothetical protein PVAG01_01788 [Phlyctema vagabunda]|uniref:F-box domain-containing protein n=1 Tax=Phlyctema vagabunda TaxID=108571 RepID=A0ABR4PY25_9HELO